MKAFDGSTRVQSTKLVGLLFTTMMRLILHTMHVTYLQEPSLADPWRSQFRSCGTIEFAIIATISNDKTMYCCLESLVKCDVINLSFSLRKLSIQRKF